MDLSNSPLKLSKLVIFHMEDRRFLSGAAHVRPGKFIPASQTEITFPHLYVHDTS